MCFCLNFAKSTKTPLVQNISGHFFGLKFCYKVFPKRAFLKIMKVFLNIPFPRRFFSVEIPKCPVYYFRNTAERVY